MHGIYIGPIQCILFVIFIPRPQLLDYASIILRMHNPQTSNGYIQQYNYTVRDRNRVLVGSVDSRGDSESLIIQVDMLGMCL